MVRIGRIVTLHQHLGTSPLFDARVHTSEELLFRQRSEAIRISREADVLLERHPKLIQDLEDRLNGTGGLEFLLVIVTCASERRDPLKYLLRTIVKLVGVVANEERSAVVVLNVGRESEQLNAVSRLVPVRRSPTSEIDASQNTRLYLSKQLKDYAHALDVCSHHDATYCCVLEDDVIVSRYVLVILRKLLRRIQRGNDRTEGWGMLKLYYKEAWMGYATEVWYEPVFVGLVCGTLAFLYRMLGVRAKRGTRLGAIAIAFIWSIFWGLLSVLLSYLYGRASLLQLRKAFPSTHAVVPPSPDAINAGNLYPRNIVSEMKEYLTNLERNDRILPSDLAVARFMREWGWYSYLVVPNALEHIGYVTTHPNKVRSVREHFGIWIP